MGFLDRLERRLGRYAVPGVTLWLIAGQAMVFVAQYAGPWAQPGGGGAGGIIARLALDPDAVLAGEWWRLLTFPFLAPLGTSPIFVLFFFWVLWFMSTTLENTWGVFRFNAFLAVGYVATVAAAFVAHAVSPGAGVITADFVYGSLFLAFARLYPDFEFYLFFVLPVKVKWLALLQWLGYAFIVVFGDWYSRLMAAAALANVLLFFGADMLKDAKRGHRQMRRQAKKLDAAPAKVVHECRVCGLTSAMAPKTAFRYCSKCAGQCCYCPEHLKDHECVTE